MSIWGEGVKQVEDCEYLRTYLRRNILCIPKNEVIGLASVAWTGGDADAIYRELHEAAMMRVEMVRVA